MKKVAIDVPCPSCRGTGYIGWVDSLSGVEPCNSCVMTGTKMRMWRWVKRINKRGTRAEIRARKIKPKAA